MTRDEARIELAERMEVLHPDAYDPFTDSADCDALIDFMVSEGWNFSLNIKPTHGGSVVTFSNEEKVWCRRTTKYGRTAEAITLCACEALGIECDD